MADINQSANTLITNVQVFVLGKGFNCKCWQFVSVRTPEPEKEVIGSILISSLKKARLCHSVRISLKEKGFLFNPDYAIDSFEINKYNKDKILRSFFD